MATITVSIPARFGILRILAPQRGNLERKARLFDLIRKFRFTDEEAESVGLRELSFAECAAKGLDPRAGFQAWDEDKRDATFEKELERAEVALLLEVLATYEGYAPEDEWAEGVVEQLKAAKK